MENNYRYRHLNEYYKNKFGERVLKICIDGGFTCPNRDGTRGTNGCIFCGERGAGEHIKPDNIKTQVKNYFSSYKAKRANKFIVYFQNFTNTYSDINTLKEKYDSALIDERIMGISIATRPDCINDEIAKLISSYKNKYYVQIELGLQTSNDKTGQLINRGYTSADFIKAVNVLNKYDIDIVAHIMVGLPYEDIEDIKETIIFINSLNITGIKIHSTYVIKNTILAKMYENHQYEPISLEEYINTVSYIISHLRSDIIIHRISGDAPKDILIAPEWNLHKKWIINGIEKKLKELNIYQGCELL